MSRIPILRPAAETDLEEAYDYRESWQPGSGAAFVATIRVALTGLAVNPQLGTEVMPGVRKKLVAGTKYCIIYLFDDVIDDVISVFHSARNPDTWRVRI